MYNYNKALKAKKRNASNINTSSSNKKKKKRKLGVDLHDQNDIINLVDEDDGHTESVEIKNSVVTEDLFESNLRKILNFGHTLGHAIETYCLTHPNKTQTLRKPRRYYFYGLIFFYKLRLLLCSIILLE